MTFQGYQRLLRINAAFKQLKQGKTLENSAYEAGYQSTVGYNTA